MTVSFSSSAATSLGFYGLSLNGTDKTYSNTAVSTYTLNGDATFVGYSMVAPVDATSANKEEYFIEVTTTTGGAKRIPVDLKSSADADFVGSTAGRSFIVSIYFKSNQQIAVDVEVADWIEEGEWQGEYAID